MWAGTVRNNTSQVRLPDSDSRTVASGRKGENPGQRGQHWKPKYGRAGMCHLSETEFPEVCAAVPKAAILVVPRASRALGKYVSNVIYQRW